MFCRRSKIHGRIRFALSPAGMRTACVGPCLTSRKREEEGGLLKTAGQDRYRGNPRVAEKGLVHMRQPLGSDGAVVFVSCVQSGEVILQRHRSRVLPGVRPKERLIQ